MELGILHFRKSLPFNNYVVKAAHTTTVCIWPPTTFPPPTLGLESLAKVEHDLD